MEFIKKNEQTIETLVADNQEYVYTAEVSRENDEVNQVILNIDRKEGDKHLRIGYINLRGGHQTCGISAGEPIAVHASVFDDLISELI